MLLLELLSFVFVFVFVFGRKFSARFRFRPDLGVSYDNNLKFGPHISHIVSKAALRAKLILKCFQSRDPELSTTAFCTFVRHILEYCSVVWSPMLKRDIHKIQTVQRRFTKRLNGL